MQNGLKTTGGDFDCRAIASRMRIERDLDLAQKCATLLSAIQEQRFDPYVRGWERAEFYSVGSGGTSFSGRPNSRSEEVRLLSESDMIQLCRSQTEDHDVVRILPRQKAKVEQFMQWYMKCIERSPKCE